MRQYGIATDPDKLDDAAYEEAIEQLDYIIEHKQGLMIGALQKVFEQAGLLKRE